MTMTITMIDNRHTHQWSSHLIMWQCDNFLITRKPQIMTLRLLIWKGSVMISPSSQGQLMEDQINGQQVCLPSLVFTVGLFVASRGRFLSRGRSGEVEQSRRGLRSSSAPRQDHQHSQVDAREARTFDIVISIIIINIIKETTFPIGPWWYLSKRIVCFLSTISRISSQDQNPFRKFHKQPELEMSWRTFLFAELWSDRHIYTQFSFLKVTNTLRAGSFWNNQLNAILY